MTSVAAISSVVARINCLKGLSENRPDGADDLLGVLNTIKESLVDADGKNPEVEREIVHLSYDIVDALAHAKSKKATKKLQERLLVLHGNLKNKNSKPVQIEKKQITSKISSMTGRVVGFINKSDDTGKSKKKQTSPKQNPNSENPEVDIAGRAVDILQWQRDHSSSPVLCVVGKSGMGKSTCARRLFERLREASSFDVCAWVSINHNFKIRKVLQILLQKLAPRQDLGIGYMDEIELIDEIYPALRGMKYMLVLDDVRSLGDWESIRLALPISKSTRVIITSSCTDFTTSNDVAVYKTSSMNQEGIHELLQKEGSFKPGLEKYAETIFEASGGSPLLATILGKSLQSEQTPDEQQLINELKSYMPPEGGSKVLAACYKWLAPETKPCLLYLSQFRRDQEIEVEKLYLLLVTENLILPRKESEICLDTLIDHLDDLASRDLVVVQENTRLRSGNHKSYRLQFQVQQFCISKASEENFLKIVDMESPILVENYTRRLVIHLSKNKAYMSIQFESQVILKEILSLLIFDIFESGEKSELPKEINDLKEFIHLRILKFDGVNFRDRNPPTGIDTLVLLRYLSFRGCWLKELPSSLSKLTQLETLDLAVQADCKMRIPNNMFTGMKRMLHLNFPKLYKRSDKKTKIQLQNLESLEILVNFDAEVCEVGALSKFEKLRILTTISNGDPGNLKGITESINTRADSLEYSSVDIRNFDCYDEARVQALEKLLQCEFIHSIHVQGQIGELPKKDNRGKKIVDIVLDGSEIEADPMEYLGLFENLQSLVLENDAIVENKIVIAATAPLFCKLRSLKLQNLDYLEKLTIEKGAMPKLSSLQIDSCTSLEKLSIPEELHERLKKAQGDDERDVYSIMPWPPNVEISK